MQTCMRCNESGEILLYGNQDKHLHDTVNQELLISGKDKVKRVIIYNSIFFFNEATKD